MKPDVKENKPEPLSRLGRKGVDIPAGVKVTIAENKVHVEGKKGKMQFQLPSDLKAAVEGTQVLVSVAKQTNNAKALHGMARKLVFNMVEGVTNGFHKKIIIEGVGYRAAVAGDMLNMTLGFSHPVAFKIPAGIKITADAKNANMLTIEGVDKQSVGQVASQIRAIRKPEPYKGTGIRYENEIIKRKAGKSAVGAAGGAAK